MSEIKVNSIKGVGASAAAITVNNTDGTCTANITNKPNRNLIINGAMQVAQRGTSNGSSGYKTVDRFQFNGGGLNANVTTSQADVASGTTPYTEGFRKAHKIVNGAQTGPDAADFIQFQTKLEAQDIANSGWNYTSSSSFITLSFWVKASVSQTYFGLLQTQDGSAHNYPFSFALTADQWTKVTKTIPGNSNLTFDNNSDAGLNIRIIPFYGTQYTNNSSTVNNWVASSSTAETPDNTSTWYTTSGSTFEYTGVQLEVGSVATDFEHRSFGQELALCQRYYETHNSLTTAKTTDGSVTSQWSTITSNDSNTLVVSTGIIYKVPKRASPTVTLYNSSDTTTAARVNAQGTERTVTASYGGPNALTRIYVSGASAGNYVTYNWEASAEL